MAEERHPGKVKWFNVVKGFGFITPDDGSADLFVHQTEILAPGFRSLRDGEAVEYSVGVGEDGRVKATQVTGPGGETPKGAPRRVRNQRRSTKEEGKADEGDAAAPMAQDAPAAPAAPEQE